MKSNGCPFCGVVTDAPHETQQGCIAALRAEIDRMREVLQLVKPQIDSAVTEAADPADLFRRSSDGAEAAVSPRSSDGAGGAPPPGR